MLTSSGLNWAWIILESINTFELLKEILKTSSKPINEVSIDKDKLPVVWINGAVQEWNLVDKYYRHYSTPKKILSLYYKTKDIHPAHRFYHTQTDTTYVIDTYEMDVKTGNT